MSSYFIEDLSFGMKASHEKKVSEGKIASFAHVSGDFTLGHMDEVYAANTFVNFRIPHGLLSAGYISTVLGSKLAGRGHIYLSQTLHFLSPVRIGDTVTARVRVVSRSVARRRAELARFFELDSKVVVDGKATVFVPSRA